MPTLSPTSNSETEVRIRPTRGQQAGLLRLAMFAAVLVLTALVLDRILNQAIHGVRFGEIGAMNRALYGDLGSEIVVDGSSRAVFHYDPRVLQKVTGMTAFNIGCVGSGTQMHLGFLRAYLRLNHTPPRVLIQNLDLPPVGRSVALMQQVEYYPYLSEPEIRDAVPGWRGWTLAHIPLYRVLRLNSRLLWLSAFTTRLPGNQEYFTNGYIEGVGHWSHPMHQSPVRVRMDPQDMADLETIASLAQSRGIELWMVVSPFYSGYTAKIMNRQEYLEQYAAIASRHGARFLDYSDSPIARDIQNFTDDVHLTPRGATIFSEDLAKRLKKDRR